jgi:tryptophan synthase alpha chain
MMNRIDKKFQELRANDEKAMIPFVTAGDPDLRTTAELVLAMEKAGADIVELGIPYSDPLADGVVIQESSNRALAAGAKISGIMETVRQIRKSSQVPLVYLVYYNSILRYGIERFLSECSDAGVDGLIIPDLPIEERKELQETAGGLGVYLIPLVAPTSKERIRKITEAGKGFVYCVSTNGVTGIRQDIGTDIGSYMGIISSYTGMPKALGFGISGPEMARKYRDYCDAVIVGSAVIKKIADAGSGAQAVEAASKFVSEIKKALM